MKVDVDLVIPNKNKSLNEGAINVSGWNSAAKDSMCAMYFKGLSEHYGFGLDTPVKDLPEEALNALLFGTGGKKIKFLFERSYGNGSYLSAFEGVINNLERRYRETNSDWMKMEIESYMTSNTCPDCNGARLKKEVLAVTVGGRNIDEVTHMSISSAAGFFRNLSLKKKEKAIAHQVLKEINERLGFLENVGLNYLTLSRPAGTLRRGSAKNPA